MELIGPKKFLEPNIFEDIKHCSEPCFLKEKNKMNLYYEGCDIFNNWGKIIKKNSQKINDRVN